VGIDTAFTFRGFCEDHDREVFAPVERHQYDLAADNSALLFCYRTLLNECRKKEKNLDWWARCLLDDRLKQDRQRYEEYDMWHGIGTFALRHMRTIKEKLEANRSAAALPSARVANLANQRDQWTRLLPSFDTAAESSLPVAALPRPAIRSRRFRSCVTRALEGLRDARWRHERQPRRYPAGVATPPRAHPRQRVDLVPERLRVDVEESPSRRAMAARASRAAIARREGLSRARVTQLLKRLAGTLDGKRRASAG